MNKLFLSKILLLIAIPLLAFTFYNCEKDDICDPLTATTPRLVITFFDISDPDEPSSATIAAFAENIPDIDTLRFANVTQIELPLDITADFVRYKLMLSDRNNADIVYSDILEFHYARTTNYVSRACGFKTTFALNSGAGLPPFVLNDNPVVVPGAWIKNIAVANYNIVNETDQHVQIFF